MAVANTISNMFCGIIKDEVTVIIEEDESISEEQNGFRKNRRETNNLYILKNQQKGQEKRKSNRTACS